MKLIEIIKEHCVIHIPEWTLYIAQDLNGDIKAYDSSVKFVRRQNRNHWISAKGALFTIAAKQKLAKDWSDKLPLVINASIRHEINLSVKENILKMEDELKIERSRIKNEQEDYFMNDILEEYESELKTQYKKCC